MGFFDFLKPKKKNINDFAQQTLKNLFPKGELDYEAGTDILLKILENKVDRKAARNIFTKSVLISNISRDNFDVERLESHLKGYCIEHFNSSQIKDFHNYLTAIKVSLVLGKSPSDVKKNGTGYSL